MLAGLCFILVSLMLVEGTFALPDLNKVFADLTQWLGAEAGMPGRGGAGTAVHVALVSDNEPQSLYPGGAVSRGFGVKNEGTGDVYFRLVYAVQYDEASWPKLTVSFNAGAGYTEHDWKDILIGTTPYKMKVFTYKDELPKGAESPEVRISIAMDTTITNEEIARYRSDFLQTQVLAIGAGDFASITIPGNQTRAEAALELALPLNELNPF